MGASDAGEPPCRLTCSLLRCDNAARLVSVVRENYKRGVTTRMETKPNRGQSPSFRPGPTELDFNAINGYQAHWKMTFPAAVDSELTAKHRGLMPLVGD